MLCSLRRYIADHANLIQHQCSKTTYCVFVVAFLMPLFVAQSKAQGLPDFSDLVEKVAPAVVNIRTVQKSSSLRYPEDVAPNKELEEFFKKHIDPRSGPPRGYVGSGFIISQDGEIVTNYHIIKEAEEIIVKMNNRRELVAELMGYDEASDVALIKVDAKNLPTVKIGSSQNLKVGQWVLAIGTPFGFEYTVTAGIVSAKGRSLPADNYVPFIQTDVAINPGNSGGPLFNLNHQVVGINSRIYTNTDSFSGLSFAVPIDLVINVIDQIREKGSVSRGFLGVHIQEMTWDLAQSFGMSEGMAGGAIVSKVIEDSPAEQAGILSGDVIQTFDQKIVKESFELPPLVGRTKVGKKVKVDIFRDGKSMVLEVVVGELPSQDKKRTQDEESESNISILGMELRELTENEKNRQVLQGGGLLVEDVSKGAGMVAGIMRNDIIITLANQRIDSLEKMRNVIDELPSAQFVTMLVVRDGNSLFLALKIP